MKQNHGKKTMDSIAHLRELRNRLLVSVLVWIIASIISYNFMDQIVAFLIQQAEGYHFIYISPSELFMQYFKMSFIVGLLAAIPVIVYQIWAFANPAMTLRERRAFLIAIAMGGGFFIAGAAFAFWVVLPVMLAFFADVSQGQLVSAYITINNYVTFVVSTIVTFGLVFEIPVLISLLTTLRLLKPQWLIKGRRYIIVAIFIIAAVITPTTDALNMAMMSVPMIILFEIGVLLCKLISRKRSAKSQ